MREYKYTRMSLSYCGTSAFPKHTAYENSMVRDDHGRLVWYPAQVDGKWKCPCCSNRVSAPREYKKSGRPYGRGRKDGYKITLPSGMSYIVASIREIVDNLSEYGVNNASIAHRIMAGQYSSKKMLDRFADIQILKC